MSANKGIVQHGGTISVGGQLAVGDNAANVRHGDDARSTDPAALAQVLEHLEDLRRALSQRATGSPDAGRAAEAATALASELAKPAPSKSTLTRLLGVLSEVATSVTAIAPATEAVVKLVKLML